MCVRSLKRRAEPGGKVRSGLEAEARARSGRVILWALLLAVVLLVTSSFSTAGPVVGKWSEPVDGLQVALGLQESLTAQASEVVVVVVFRNAGDSPCQVPAEAMGGINIIQSRGRWAGGGAGTTLSPRIPDGEPLLQPGEQREYADGPLIAGMGSGVYTLRGGLGWRTADGRGVGVDLGSVAAIVQ